jgi:hypothetical protein
MSHCPHHDHAISSAPAVGCPLHQQADVLLDLAELVLGGARLVLVVVDEDDVGHRCLAANLEMGVALHVLEREAKRLRDELEQG